jgi:hypothetical protein
VVRLEFRHSIESEGKSHDLTSALRRLGFDNCGSGKNKSTDLKVGHYKTEEQILLESTRE